MQAATDTLQSKIAFLATFFSFPGKDSYRALYAGESPLGKLEIQEPFDDFCMALETEITELFVNSPLQLPLFPVASEYVSEARKARLREELSVLYSLHGKVVTHLPQDHLQVLLEFLAYLLAQDEIESAAEFCRDYIGSWTEDFVSAMLQRKPSEPLVRVAQLLPEICEQCARVT